MTYPEEISSSLNTPIFLNLNNYSGHFWSNEEPREYTAFKSGCGSIKLTQKIKFSGLNLGPLVPTRFLMKSMVKSKVLEDKLVH